MDQRLLFTPFAGALGGIGEPKVIPTLIGVIEEIIASGIAFQEGWI